MKVALHSNMCDTDTSKIAQALHEPFRAIGADISGDYGGIMEHLWVDFELVRHHANLRQPRSFRFQKRVSGKDRFTGLDGPDMHNVGHYSVRPDFDHILALPIERTVIYALSLILSSTSILQSKVGRIGSFNAALFRSNFSAACASRGYNLASPLDAR